VRHFIGVLLDLWLNAWESIEFHYNRRVFSGQVAIHQFFRCWRTTRWRLCGTLFTNKRTASALLTPASAAKVFFVSIGGRETHKRDRICARKNRAAAGRKNTTDCHSRNAAPLTPHSSPLPYKATPPNSCVSNIAPIESPARPRDERLFAHSSRLLVLAIGEPRALSFV